MSMTTDEVLRIKPVQPAGKMLAYDAKANSGTGAVFAVEEGETGPWVVLIDYERRKFVTVRPSQVSRCKAVPK